MKYIPTFYGTHCPLRENKNIFDKEHNNNEYYVAPKMLSNNLKVVLSQLFIVPLPTKQDKGIFDSYNG